MVMHKSCLLALLLLGVASGQLLAQASRPNILYFYVDDMGWGSIGPNGQTLRREKGLPYVRTPNLNRLAAQGVNFSRGYGCTVCSPARSSQQSGFHQGHTFSDRNDPNNAKKAMRASDVLMGDVLSAAGYATGYWGKWGYGGSSDLENPEIVNQQTLPTSHGYQHVLAELHHVRAHTFFQPTLWSAPAKPNAVGGLELVKNSMAKFRGQANYPATPALQNHADYPDIGYCDDAYAFAGLDFVRQQGQAYNQTGQPFFGLLAVQIPHAPFGEVAQLPDWDSAYADDPHFAKLAAQSQQWSAMVTRIDAHFGNILAALEDPNGDGDTSDSIADNTLVILQSDNGGPGGKNNTELDANGGLRGNKGSIFEGGLRVPLIMRWPAQIHATSTLKAGTQCDRVVDVTDLLPTFCELAGARSPLGIDGVSIAPTLLSAPGQRPREFIIHEAGNSQSIIRGDHKLIRTAAGRGKSATLQLFDLGSDRSETIDIAQAQPERLKELETLLLGERVAEPKGFANTYHHWIGDDGADAAQAGNWSDYIYASDGVTYMQDDGPPQLAWVAEIRNSGNTPNTAQANTDLAFLGLEIAGNAASGASQVLALGNGVHLTGRNEIRIAAQGVLKNQGGTLSTLRWIEVAQAGELSGHGTIAGDLINAGLTRVVHDSSAGLELRGDFHQSATGVLDVSLMDSPQTPAMAVAGQAVLGGRLKLSVGKAADGQPLQILVADGLSGRFDNPNNQVVASDGTAYSIQYTENSVVLQPE